MRRIKEVLRLRVTLGDNVTAIAAGAQVARSSVRKYLKRAEAAGIDAATAEGMADDALEAALFPGNPLPGDRTVPVPDWASIDQDLRRNRHVTLKLVWMEYRTSHPDGFGLTQFKHHYLEWRQQARPGLSMHQTHRAGETVQVDYAGDTIGVTIDGSLRQAQLFVACLPATGLIFVDPTWTQKQEDWLASHIRLFEFLGGVPVKVVPDNLKTGVTHASYYDPLLNPSYAALIKYYNTAVVPARAGKPKDKPSVENAVLQAYRWVLACLRNRQFFSLPELKQAIQTLVTDLNDKPLSSPREGSRRSLFEAIERSALRPLPKEPYIIGEWRIEKTVNKDYHIALDYNYYSVHYALIGKKVDAFLTPALVEIFHRGQRVACHPRASGKNHWKTCNEHMPPAHSAVANRTPDTIRAEAAKIGIATAAYVERLLTSRDHIEQGVRSCLGILRLATQYPHERLEQACRGALAAGVRSSGYVEQWLKTSHALPDPTPDTGAGSHANLRGPGYYH
jgi:transposase